MTAASTQKKNIKGCGSTKSKRSVMLFIKRTKCPQCLPKHTRSVTRCRTLLPGPSVGTFKGTWQRFKNDAALWKWYLPKAGLQRSLCNRSSYSCTTDSECSLTGAHLSSLIHFIIWVSLAALSAQSSDGLVIIEDRALWIIVMVSTASFSEKRERQAGAEAYAAAALG